MTAHTDEFGQPIDPALPDWTAPPIPPKQPIDPALRTAFAPWLAPESFDDQGRQRTCLLDLSRPIREKNAAQM